MSRHHPPRTAALTRSPQSELSEIVSPRLLGGIAALVGFAFLAAATFPTLRRYLRIKTM